MGSSTTDYPELDNDWIELISYAKKIGMSIEEIRNILIILRTV